MRIALLALLPLTLAACGGTPGGTTSAAAPDTTTATQPTTTTTTPPPPTTTAPEPEALPGLPSWTAGYDEWTKLNDQPLPPRSPDPHLGTKNVYVSSEAVNGVYPVGTMIVKEGFRPDKDFVGLIAAMRKLEGENPDVDDWVFVEWARDSAGSSFTELASGAVCESCHAGVAGQDYVFTQG